LGYRMVKKLWQCVKPFSSNTGTSRMDGRTEFLYQYRALMGWRAIKTTSSVAVINKIHWCVVLRRPSAVINKRRL